MENLQKRARIENYNKAKEDVEQRHPGEGYRSWRNRILKATVLIASAIAAGFAKYSPQQKQYIEGAQ